MYSIEERLAIVEEKLRGMEERIGKLDERIKNTYDAMMRAAIATDQAFAKLATRSRHKSDGFFSDFFDI